MLTANYAIYYEKRELWEAKGDVVVAKSDGKTLYTQQLFWNARTKKIYSNVDSKIVQRGGTDVFIGEGFESDEEFKDWRFRRMKGRMEVDVTPGTGTDTAAHSARPSPGVPNGGGTPTAAGGRTAKPEETGEVGKTTRVRPTEATTPALDVRSDGARMRMRSDALRNSAADHRRAPDRAKMLHTADSLTLRMDKATAAAPGGER